MSARSFASVFLSSATSSGEATNTLRVRGSLMANRKYIRPMPAIHWMESATQIPSSSPTASVLAEALLESSDEQTQKPGDAASAGGGPIQAGRHKSVDAEAAAGIGEEEDDRQHDQHDVRPSPLVRHAEDADRDVGGHPDGDQGTETGEEPEDQCDG